MASLSRLLCFLVVGGTAIMSTESQPAPVDLFHPSYGPKYHVFWTKSSWFDARVYCQSLGGDLAVHVVTEYRLILPISNRMLNADDNFWIGLTDQQHEGQWMWVDGTSGSTRGIGWASGAPNHHAGNKDDCAQIRASTEFSVSDYPCEDHFSAICEIPN